MNNKPLKGMFFWLLLVGLLTITWASQITAAQPESPDYIVVMKKGPEGKSQAQAHAKAHKAKRIYQSVFNGFTAPLNEQARAALLANPNVELIEEVFTVQAIAETLPAGIDRIDAELAHIQGATGIGARVAVVDTGIDPTHPDLLGQIDAVLSRTFVSFGSSPSGGRDDNGHGTHVAGTISAIAGNNQGVVGVAPQANLVALKVLDSQGSGSSADIISALDYIVAHNQAATSYADMIHIANFSLGGSGTDSDSAFRRAFEAVVNSGCFVVVAAGNESRDAAFSVPAAYDSVFTVSAMDPANDSFANFSNYGMDIDMAAPGVDVLSTIPGGGYASYNGTSMAAPHVAGGAALYVSKMINSLNANSAVQEIRNALLTSAEAISLAGDRDQYAEPLLDAQQLVGDTTPPISALLMSVTTDKSSYTINDIEAVLTVTLRNEIGVPVENLQYNDFVVSGAPVTEFVPLGNGNYQIILNISGLVAEVGYSIIVQSTDDRGESASTAFQLIRSAAKYIYASAIDYQSTRRSLNFSVTVMDSTGVHVPGATVSVTLNRNGSSYGSATATTGNDGRVHFSVRRAPSGFYATTINNILYQDYVYNANLNTVDSGYQR